MPYFIGHDLGTGGNKAVLVDETGRVLADAFSPYGLTHPHPGWAEQDPTEWWDAVVSCTREVVRRSGIAADQVTALSFAGQMLALVAMRHDGSATRPAISWLDHRAEVQARQMVNRLGGPKIVGALVGVLPTAKDIVAKLAWIRANEPEIFRTTSVFADATSYLLARSSGQLVFDHTGAAATGLLDARTRTWSRLLAWLCRAPLEKFPPLRRCAELVGPLTEVAAEQLGLTRNTLVATGMADVPSAAIGSGAVGDGDGHIYLGTSSWLGVMVEKPINLPRHGIASVAAPDPTLSLLIAESETAGACIDWLMRALDESVSDYPRFEQEAAASPAGAKGLLFLPWLFGERSPVPDPNLRGGFANLSLEHRRGDLCRAVYEGIAFNLRWTLDAVQEAGLPCPSLRAIGGGARSPLWLQTIADITGREIQRVAAPQHAGAVGCALASAVASRILPNLEAIKKTVIVDATFRPNASNQSMYDHQYRQFRGLTPALRALNRRDLSEGRRTP